MTLTCPNSVCDRALEGPKSWIGRQVVCPGCGHGFVWTDRFREAGPFVICDPETTGLDPDHNEFIQIAALRFEGGQVIGDDSFFNFARPEEVLGRFSEWASLPDARGHLDTETPPSQSANRKEIIALMLEDGNRQGSMLIPIVRGWNEVFVGFGDTAPVAYGQSEGRFSGMMPPRKPGPDDRAKAAALLQALGLNIFNRGFDPKLN